jgi:hypothetical protein
MTLRHSPGVLRCHIDADRDTEMELVVDSYWAGSDTKRTPSTICFSGCRIVPLSL